MRIAIFFICLLTAATVAVAEDIATPAVEKIRTQIEALPEDDVWWTANGEDMHWNNRNLHRFLPTVNVYRSGPVSALPTRENSNIADFPVDVDREKMRFSDWLEREDVTTMSVVILHKGRIVFEAYPGQAPFEKPIWWSVTKVGVSAVLAMLEAEGQVDVDKPIETYLPDLSTSSFAGVTVRNLLDMATGLACDEDYSDRNSCYYQLAVALGDGFYTADDPDDPYEVLSQIKVERFAPQGTAYHYSSVNTFILGWLVEELTGEPFQDVFSRRIWMQMGAEHDASILAPRFGVPITYGGLMATPRDVARFGLLHTRDWRRVASEPVLPIDYVNFLKDGGNPDLMANARFGAPAEDVDHNVYQWDLVFDNNDLFKGGWAGQGLLVNPDKRLVAVYTGYLNEEGEGTNMLPLMRRMLNEIYPD